MFVNTEKLVGNYLERGDNDSEIYIYKRQECYIWWVVGQSSERWGIGFAKSKKVCMVHLIEINH